MILILGGTTEGRKGAETLDKAGKTFFYSTKNARQEIVSSNAVRLTGALDETGMESLCREKGIRLIVDAAHPFASRLHATVAVVGRRLNLPVVRYERRFPERDPRLIWCEDFEDAVKKLQQYGIKRLLALTGVQTIDKLKGFWLEHDSWFRILDREDSIEKAIRTGFNVENLLFYQDDGDIEVLLKKINPDAIITKESGESGGFLKKVNEALDKGVKVFVVCRPPSPEGFIPVTGEHGLRKAVERLVPGYFELRSGFTTGACATAASKAALLALLESDYPEKVAFRLPDGEEMLLPVADVRLYGKTTASATIVKDGGDDPDVTDKSRIVATVTLACHGEVHFFGGEGVGRVTLPGVGLQIGDPAINPVPRKMMRDELLNIYPPGCDVTISVPGGEELAKRTFNSRIGIEGGISIIGTTGIVMPFSNEAFLEAIRKEMEVAKAMKCKRVVLNSGARSEKAVKTAYPALPAAAFIHYGNAIGESLKIAEVLGIRNLTVGIMIGKAVKLAEGNADTHSHKVTLSRDFLMSMARNCGCSHASIETISRINMARELWSSLSPDDADKFFSRLLSLCKDTCRACYKTGELTLMLISDDGQIKYTD